MSTSSNASTECYHCGLPVPNGVDYPVVIDGSARPMCCPGCQAVASTIVSTGLDQYYQYRTDLAVTPKPLEDELLDELALYDRKDIQQDFVNHTDNQQTDAIFLVEGITCAACTWLIEHQLNQLEASNTAVLISVTTNSESTGAAIRLNSASYLRQSIALVTKPTRIKVVQKTNCK